jgi:streptomycin 6-kinase
MSLALPPGLVARRSGNAWADWVDRLPSLVADLLTEWQLSVDGAPLHGFCALVLPVRTDGAARAVLKIGFDGDEETRHEALALRHWNGRGAVRLLRADPRRRAMLLERIGPGDLRALHDLAACAVVGGLYRSLHIPAPPQLAPLSGFVGRWLDDLAALGRDALLPRRLVDQAVSLGRDLLAGGAGAPSPVIVHGDLHYENVLGAERAPWLAIDPQPMAGDPHYEPAPMLWDRWPELDHDRGVRDGIRRRLHTLCACAGLDPDRARDWVVVRSMTDAGWSIADAARAGRALTAEERAWVTARVTAAKAVQD